MKNSKIGKKGVSVPVRAGTKRPLLTLRERSIIEIHYTKDNKSITDIATEIHKNKRPSREKCVVRRGQVITSTTLM